MRPIRRPMETKSKTRQHTQRLQETTVAPPEVVTPGSSLLLGGLLLAGLAALFATTATTDVPVETVAQRYVRENPGHFYLPVLDLAIASYIMDDYCYIGAGLDVGQRLTAVELPVKDPGTIYARYWNHQSKAYESPTNVSGYREWKLHVGGFYRYFVSEVVNGLRFHKLLPPGTDLAVLHHQLHEILEPLLEPLVKKRLSTSSSA